MRFFLQGFPRSAVEPVLRVCGIVGMAALFGCGTTGVDRPQRVDIPLHSYRDRLAAEPILSRQFRACLAQERNSDPAPDDEPITPVRGLIRKIRERNPAGGDSLSKLQDLVAGLMDDNSRSWDPVSLKGVVVAARFWQERIDVEEEELEAGASRFARLLAAYNKAYFGNLRLVASSPTPGRAGVAVRPVTSVGFVDRSGRSFLFPGLSFETGSDTEGSAPEPTIAADSQRIGSDLTRIFLEAFFDAAFEVPAVQGATALDIDWGKEQPFPEFRSDQPAIPLDAMARVTRDALRVEAAVMTKVGEAVRGGSVAGTGNETVAASLETAAGVTAKKLVEHGGFCYFQVKPTAAEGR